MHLQDKTLLVGGRLNIQYEFREHMGTNLHALVEPLMRDSELKLGVELRDLSLEFLRRWLVEARYMIARHVRELGPKHVFQSLLRLRIQKHAQILQLSHK